MSSTEALPPVRAVFERLRGPAAVLLLAVNGFLLVVGLFSIPTSSLDVTDALATSRGWFLGLAPALLPALAVVLAAVVNPPKEKLVPLVSIVAVAELGFAALFGLVTMLSTFAAGYSTGSKFVAFLEGLAWLALIAGALFFAVQTLLAVRGSRPAQAGYAGYPGAPYGEGMPGDTGSRPAAHTGAVPMPGGSPYGQPGQPQQGWPPQQGSWPGQGAQQGQPTGAQPTSGAAYGTPGQSSWPGQPGGPGQPAGPGQSQWPSQAPTSGQPGAYAPPSSGVPYGGQPGQPGQGYAGQPASGPPYGAPGPAGAYPAPQPGYGPPSSAPTSGYPGPTSGYPTPPGSAGRPDAQDTNVVNVNDLLPPEQGGAHRPRNADDER
ncbi:hypothetical protein [Cryptosporangium minutisporangium]|uniref:Uncharacterized protein n=1 Tax=Cryptosporangium minutisporangium TaxID=113569 RepID=A0ABP6SUD0_9ACTN